MNWLPDMDLNHDKQIQSLLCYRYTIGQCEGGEKVSPLLSQSRRASQMNADNATIKALQRLDAVGFDELSEPEKVLATIWAVEAEVNNGGFDQFFFNSAGDLAFYAPTALARIGATQMAELAEKANSVFGPDGPPRDWETRRALVRQFSDEVQSRLDQVDNAFYKYPDNLRQLLDEYVSRTGNV